MSTTTQDRLPPHSHEAEQGVLGCALESPDASLATMAEKRVTANWFYDLRHQTVFNALQTCYAGKREVPVDMISVMQTLKNMGQLEEIGGIPYLNALQDSIGSASNLTYYLGVVRDKMRARKLIAFGTMICGRAFDHTGPMDELYDEVESDFESMSTPDAIRTERHIQQVILDSVVPLIERHYSRGKTQLDGLPTGDNWYLDKMLLGIAPNDYVILAGRPGEGKTSLALNIVNYLAKDYVHFDEITQGEWETLPDGERSFDEEKKKYFKRVVGIPIGIFTLEMTEESLGFRLVFGRAQVSSASFRQGFATEGMWGKVNKSVEELCKTNIYLDGEADQTIDMIAAKARRWAKQYGIKLFVLDYLQLLDTDDGDNDRVRALRKISKKIVSLKKRLNIPWLVLAQMNRNIETAERARRPVMSDLKESGSLEQDADKIVILYHPLKNEGIEEDEEAIDVALVAESKGWGFTATQSWKTQNERDFESALYEIPNDTKPRRINALVVKNRNGPTGVASLLFQNNQCLFQDWRRWCVEKQVVQRAKGEAGRKIDDEDVPC